MRGIWQRITGRGPQGLACVELVELVSDYLEGALSPAEQARFEQHIDDCADCTHYLEEMRVTIALAGKIEEDDLSDAAKDDLLAAFREWART
jgi:anti-sigma factor RsiW